jgi:pilus assembly protein CpaC
MFARLAFPRPTVAALALAAAMAALATVPAPARAQATQRITSSEERPDRVVHLALSKSKILDFDEEIRDILVSDPKIADAVVRSSKRLYLIGNKFGTTNVVVFGANGRAVANLEIQVEIDTGALETLLRRLMPKSNIKVEAVRGTVVLSGTVASSTDAIQAHEVASRFVGADPKVGATTTGSTGATAGSDASGSSVQVVNALTIGGKDQVMLKVTIAEIQREAVKKLGINISGSGTQGNWSGAVATANTFPITPAVSPSAAAGVGGSFGPWSLSANLKALEQNSLIKTLAEPNLSALSGEQAQFLVGGEYPVPVSQSSGSSGSTIGVEFKTYGIALNFQPVVLA